MSNMEQWSLYEAARPAETHTWPNGGFQADLLAADLEHRNRETSRLRSENRTMKRVILLLVAAGTIQWLVWVLS